MYLIRIPKDNTLKEPEQTISLYDDHSIENHGGTTFINSDHIIMITVTTAKEDNGLESQIWIISLSDSTQIILRDWEQIKAFQNATEGLIAESHSFYHHRLEDEHYNLLEKYKDLKTKAEELEDEMQMNLQRQEILIEQKLMENTPY